MQRGRHPYSPRYAPEPPPAPRCCDANGCAAAGEYRAPKARDKLNDYFWFCLDHVREYNKAWDYYAGMSADQIERHVRLDTTWQRPTWPMGSWQARERALREEAMRQRQYGFRTGREEDEEDAPPRRPSMRTAEQEALATLALVPPVTFEQIKARYRELVKRHHPDANGGAREAEERLKQINLAYTTLKTSYGA
ncbi:J domain-containing protein [Arenibaculum pallidiluteum]|uniref:J domain-containing protein n=1 Tax=Arenibaculum pallidiluteum TaxID=2812559 RepID=UPI001A97542D|nr:J domain-containing protein [Arenibaculum pallidiluteum]